MQDPLDFFDVTACIGTRHTHIDEVLRRIELEQFTAWYYRVSLALQLNGLVGRTVLHADVYNVIFQLTGEDVWVICIVKIAFVEFALMP